jgi:hypothetical protein
MATIFISYRHLDTGLMCDRLKDYLATIYPRDAVFRDMESIAGGERFHRTIDEALEECKVMLVLIGPRWLEPLDVRGMRRIDQADDMVRYEIETALRRAIPIIPVLIEEAQLPARAALPPSIAAIVDFQARQLRSGLDFAADVKRLVVTVKRYVRQPRAHHPIAAVRRLVVTTASAAFGALTLLATTIAIATWLGLSIDLSGIGAFIQHLISR